MSTMPATAIVEAAGEGNDRSSPNVSYALAAGVQVETLSTVANDGTTAINLTGNELANTLFGNAGANSSTAGAARTRWYGPAATTPIIVDNAGDLVIEVAGQGNDRSSASPQLRAGGRRQVETLTPPTACAAPPRSTSPATSSASTIFGNNGANMLDGGGGADTMSGLGGNDTYYRRQCRRRGRRGRGRGQ